MEAAAFCGRWPPRGASRVSLPDTISTDLHAESINIQQSTMPNVMSKLMLLGMSLEDVLVRSTVNPAKEIGRYPEVGTLGVGRVADIALLEQRTGVFVFKDSWPAKRLGTKRLECVMTIRAGNVVYERGARRRGRSGHHHLRPAVQARPHRRSSQGEWDVAIVGDRIARVGQGLKASHARTVVEAEEYQLAPAGVVEGGGRESRHCLTLADRF